jgi:hypothetical protein
MFLKLGSCQHKIQPSLELIRFFSTSESNKIVS